MLQRIDVALIIWTICIFRLKFAWLHCTWYVYLNLYVKHCTLIQSILFDFLLMIWQASLYNKLVKINLKDIKVVLTRRKNATHTNDILVRCSRKSQRVFFSLSLFIQIFFFWTCVLNKAVRHFPVTRVVLQKWVE